MVVFGMGIRVSLAEVMRRPGSSGMANAVRDNAWWRLLYSILKKLCGFGDAWSLQLGAEVCPIDLGF